MKLFWSLIILVAVICPASLFAQTQSTTESGEKGDVSLFDAYSTQGEYSGELDINESALKIAAQVIAMGDDKFRITVFPGGLPGDGWVAGGDRHEGDSTIEDGNIVFERNGEKFVVADGMLKAVRSDGQVMGEIKKVSRKSATEGQKPPEGSVVLFDGSSGENFKTRNGDDPMVDGLLRQGVTSIREFGDCQLHIEFKLPFLPTRSDQARGNSGIYIQGRYEVQMLDSFGLTGEHNECGGLYSIKKPDLNMCYPPESWQTYDIDFTAATWLADEKTANARMTVRHNGVLIHDDVELPNPTTAAPNKEADSPGFISLQDHGSQVRYRNIWVLEK